MTTPAVPQYGRSIHFGRTPMVRTTHRVAVVKPWRNRRMPGKWTQVRWNCGSGDIQRDAGTRSFELFDELEENAHLCKTCFRDPAHDVPVVYFARTPSGAIKIGTTRDLRKRMADLRLELLAWQLGGYEVEHTLHRVFADLLIPTLGQECFIPGPRLLLYIERIQYDGMDEAAA